MTTIYIIVRKGEGLNIKITLSIAQAINELHRYPEIRLLHPLADLSTEPSLGKSAEPKNVPSKTE